MDCDDTECTSTAGEEGGEEEGTSRRDRHQSGGRERGEECVSIHFRRGARQMHFTATSAASLRSRRKERTMHSSVCGATDDNKRGAPKTLSPQIADCCPPPPRYPLPPSLSPSFLGLLLSSSRQTTSADDFSRGGRGGKNESGRREGEEGGRSSEGAGKGEEGEERSRGGGGGGGEWRRERERRSR